MAGHQGGSGADWGSVTVEPLAPSRGSVGRVQTARYTWRPPPGAAAELPPDFALAFDCLAGPDGVRRFAPGGPVPAFVVRAALGGYALLATRPGLTPEQRFSYHATRLVFQKAAGLREHLDRTFARESDLYVTRAGQAGGDEGHVLPADLGLDAGGRGTPWGPRDVIANGRDEALAAGHPDPDPAACIRLGLLAAARRNPLDPAAVSEAGGLGLVRLALFDLGPAPGSVDGTVADTVEARLCAALERHAGDDTESFSRWFFGSPDDLAHAIAKQKKGGGPVPREVVRQALLELVFRSYRYVGDCVHLQATAFARALPDPLTAGERAIFGSLYRKQPYLGGLPLVLLHDRFAFLREAILDVWADPLDAGRVGTLLRLLEYYGVMVGKRREADRRYKARSQHRNERGRVGRELELDPDRDAAPGPTADRFQEIAAVLRDTRGATCPCGTTHAWRATLADVGEAADPVVIEDGCGRCGYRETVEITRDQILQAGRDG